MASNDIKSAPRANNHTQADLASEEHKIIPAIAHVEDAEMEAHKRNVRDIEYDAQETLGSSQVDSGSSSPLAVLDSGGVAILVGYKQWTDQIYGKYNVKASADGLCEWIMPGKGDRRTYLQTDYLAPLKSLYPSPSAARTLPRTRWTCHGLTPPTQAKQHALAPSNTRPHSVRPATLCSARRSSRTSTPSFSIPTTSAVPNGSRLSVSSRLRTHPLHLRTSTPFGYNDSHSRMSRQTINRA